MPDSIQTEAQRLYEAGYDVIPLNGKKPLGHNWVANPQLGVDEVLAQTSRGRNIGVRLGRQLSDGRFLACLDVDITGKLKASEKAQVDELLAQYVSGDAPVAVTGFGNASRHVYVATEKPAKTQKLGQATRKVEYTKAGKTKNGPVWTVELRGLGAQVVLPPSVHPDTQACYRWKAGSRLNGAGQLPDLVLPTSGQAQPSTLRAKGRTTTSKPPSPVDVGAALASIPSTYRTLLEGGALGDEYESRSEALYAVVGVLVRDTDLDDAQIEALVLKYPLGEKARERPTGWVAGQAAKLREKLPSGEGGVIAQAQALPEGAPITQLQPILKRAAISALSPIEMDRFVDTVHERHGLTKRAIRDEIVGLRKQQTPEARSAALSGDAVYEEVCQRHALVSWAGKPAIFRERVDPPAWESRYDITTLNAVATFYENKPVMVGKKAVNPVEVWRADPARREFLEGARLVPPDEHCPDGVFNLWQGFSVEPKRGKVKLWQDFLLEVVCGGHAGYLSWLEDWIADLFQNPGNPKGVAVVMRGEEGIGKGTFANALGHLLGGHYRHVTQESQLTGRFNGHFADSALIFADELIWGGDKKNRGTLYALVTEKYLMVERKNFDAVPMRNLNRMIIASNNDWVVPTGMDGRRWFVLDVSNKRKGDTTYFSALRKFLHEKGGLEAILEYYLRRKISHDLRRAPVTQALIEQKVAGFDATTAWWTAVMERGCVRVPVGEATSAWESRISKELLRNSYHTFCGDYGVKPVYHAIMMKGLHKLVPWIHEVRGRENERRVQMVELPELDVCQEYFQRLLGGDLVG